MMINNYEELKRDYGKFSSWAIWDENNILKTEIIEQNKDKLHSDVIIVGLNVSADIEDKEPWKNFHGGKNDKRLMELFNGSSYYGAYMTDLIKTSKSPNSSETNIADQMLINSNIPGFITEMETIGASEDSLFILFGWKVQKLFCSELIFRFPNVVHCEHFSQRRKTVEAWLSETRNKLVDHYEKTKDFRGTKEFIINR